MSLSVSGFINKIRNMINYRTMTKEEIKASSELTALQNEGWTTIRQRDNIDKASIKGVSANLKLLLPYGFTVAGGYTFSNTEAETKSLNTKTQEYIVKTTPVDKSVKNVANVMAAWDHSWQNYHLNVHINGHIQSKRYSSTYGYAPEYQQWDIMTKHTFSLKQVIVEPGIGVDNVFNKRDTSYWNSNFSTVNPGRSLFLSLTLRFKD